MFGSLSHGDRVPWKRTIWSIPPAHKQLTLHNFLGDCDSLGASSASNSPAYGESDEFNALGRALIRQSRLSAAAAASAAVAAFSQALAVLTA
jgi:hypothetical protein